MKRMWIASMLCCLALSGCAQTPADESAPSSAPSAQYVSITAQEAQNLMQTQADYVLLDVRTPEEYNEAHIPGAMLLPLDELAAQAETALPDKAQLILVYCRSGRRSKTAAETLLSLGYTNVRDFGGILDWPYGTTS